MHKLTDNLNIKAAVERSKLDLTANDVFACYPDARDFVISSIIRECESLLSQIRSFMRGIGDLVISMRFTSSTLYGEVVDLHPSVFASGIFNEDHMLIVQQLSSQFDCEYCRKTELIDRILGGATGMTAKLESFVNSGSKHKWIDEKAVEEAASSWLDVHSSSFLDVEKLQIFILTNDVHSK